MLRLRFNHPDVSLVLLHTRGSLENILAIDEQLIAHAENPFVKEVILHMKRVIKRMDVTAKSFFALVDPDVELRSGIWRPNVVEVRSLPKNEVERVHVYLNLVDSLTSRMLCRLAPGQLDPDLLPVLALDPFSRELMHEGERWEFHSMNRPDLSMSVPSAWVDGPHRVVFYSSGGGTGSGPLPDGIVLGAAKDEELLDLIATHRLK